ncbi:MAG: site-2 protease family protein [Chloroflexi bacterium]|nr:site-2 protease family protein [Chloroflexota bacterium]
MILWQLFSDPQRFVVAMAALVVALTVHEFAHAFWADRLGDPTPRRQRRLTLNPLAHLDPFGSLLFLLAGFGWGRPVMTDPRYYRLNPRVGMAQVAFAGPLSNVALAMLVALPLRFGFFDGGAPDLAASFVAWSLRWNILLAVFNMIPLAPLDGFKVLLGVLPSAQAFAFARFEQYGPAVLMTIIFVDAFTPLHLNILGRLIGPPSQFLLRAIVG